LGQSLKKGGQVSSDTEAIPESVDTGVRVSILSLLLSLTGRHAWERRSTLTNYCMMNKIGCCEDFYKKFSGIIVIA